MWKTIVFLASFLTLGVSPVFSDNIYTSIREGHLKEARDSLSRISTAFSRDGNILFFQSLIEGNADKSAQLMKAALQASVSAGYRQEIYYRLAQYYFMKNDYHNFDKWVNDYLKYWEGGKYRKEMLRYTVLLDEKKRAYDNAIRQTDRYLLEYNTSNIEQWGLIDKVRVMLEFKKSIGAKKLLKRLSREPSGPGVPQALYLLTENSIQKNKTDDAVFYYNLLREGYPQAVGAGVLVDKMQTLSEVSNNDNTAEKFTKTFYSIQVGVFSIKNNSHKQARKFKKYNKKTEIKSKNISNAKYYVVYVGHFANYASAYNFKKKLESEFDEVFQVVAR